MRNSNINVDINQDAEIKSAHSDESTIRKTEDINKLEYIITTK